MRKGDLVELPTGAQGRLVVKTAKVRGLGPCWLVDVLTGNLKGRQARHEQSTLSAWKGKEIVDVARD